MDLNGLVQYFNDPMVVGIMGATIVFAIILTIVMYAAIQSRSGPQGLGRIKMRKKYRFHQVVGEFYEEGVLQVSNLPKLSSIVLAETNSFREAEKLRSKFPGTVAIVYDQTQQEVKNAESDRDY